MADGREVELKFLIDDGGVEQVAAHPALAAALSDARSSLLDARYFDTDDRRLWRRGISLRIREAEGRRVQTVKRAGPSSIDRGEWETETQEAVPDPAHLRRTPAARALRGHADEPLRELFRVAVHRRTARVVHGSAEIEIALDLGNIEAGGKSLPVRELELELKSGDLGDLFDMARPLCEALPVVPGLVSKSERGMWLCDGDEAHGAAPLGLKPDMPATEAFAVLAEAGLKAFCLDAASITPEIDVEAVHATRVALRRLRAALGLFAPVARDDRSPAIRSELQWMSDLLGRARDLDVFQTELFDPAARAGSDAGAAELAEHMRTEQRQAHGELVRALQSRRWRVAVAAMVEWLHIGSWRQAPEGEPVRLDAFVTARLKRQRKTLLKKAEGLDELSDDERHRVRIRAKKLRYGMAFLTEVKGLGKGSRSYKALLDALEGLQGSLGHLHDHEAQAALLRQEVEAWARQPGAPGRDAAFAAGHLVGDTPELERSLKQARAALRTLRKTQPFA